ncbi:MAG: hypothetical protein QW286_03350, partial [Candidatus Aenigmatarchaeota archaeon]
LKSKDILRSFRETGFSYPFTSALVKIAETEGLEKSQKENAMSDIIEEMKGFCELNSEKIEPLFYKNITMLLDCARNDIKRGDFYAAISDVESIESNYLFKLQKELSEIRAPDVKNLLLKRMVESQMNLYGMRGVFVELVED